MTRELANERVPLVYIDRQRGLADVGLAAEGSRDRR
jgi:hypothetical protein